MVNLLHWGIIVLLLLALPSTLWPLTPRFWSSLAIWVVVFTILALSFIPTKESTVQLKSIPVNTYVYNILLVIAIALTPLYLYQSYKLVLDYGLDNYFLAARMVALDEDTNMGLLAYCVVINQVLFVATVMAGNTLAWWKHLLVAVLYALCGIAIMEKGTLIFMIIVSAMVYYQRDILKIRHIAIVGVALIIAAFAFTMLRSDDSDNLQDQSSFQTFFETYVLAGPVAYCYMPDETSVQPGVNTFSQFYLIANKLNIANLEVKDKLQEFIEVPVYTNTYTVFQPFYLDYGLWGIALFAAIYGLLFGLIFRFYQMGNAFAAVVYGYFIAMLCLQFHQEEIFSSFIRTIQYIVFAFLITLPSFQHKLAPNE